MAPLINRSTLKPMVEQLNIGVVKDDVLDFVRNAAEYHLKDVIQEAVKVSRRSKRHKLTTEDVNYALEMRSVEAMYGFRSAMGPASGPGGETMSLPETEERVALAEVANATLPPFPIEPNYLLHWLAVDGNQPKIPENPRNMRSGADGGNLEAGALHELSEESARYFERVKVAVVGSGANDAAHAHIFENLQTDAGVQDLLPHLTNFLNARTVIAIKKRELGQLSALLKLANCLLSNGYFHHIEFYLEQILPSLLSIQLSAILTEDPFEDHWSLRRRAAGIVSRICWRFGQTFPNLQSDVVLALGRALKDVKKSALTTQYGAIVGMRLLGMPAMEAVLLPVFKTYEAYLAENYLDPSNVRESISAAQQPADSMEIDGDDVLRKSTMTEAEVRRKEAVQPMEAWQCYGAVTEAAGQLVIEQERRLLQLLPPQIEINPAARRTHFQPSSSARCTLHGKRRRPRASSKVEETKTKGKGKGKAAPQPKPVASSSASVPAPVHEATIGDDSITRGLSRRLTMVREVLGEKSLPYVYSSLAAENRHDLGLYSIPFP